MHDLVEAASRALSSHDADALEELAAAAVRRRHEATPLQDLQQLRRATDVLAAQVRAAGLYLNLRSRGLGERFGTGREDPWQL